MISNLLTNKGEAEATIVYYSAEGELETETDGESIMSAGGQKTGEVDAEIKILFEHTLSVKHFIDAMWREEQWHW